MSWFKSKERTLTLDSLGYPELFVNFREMNSLSYKQTKDLQDRVSRVLSDDDDEAAEESGMDSMKIMFAELITSWNIPPMDKDLDSGEVLPLPKENADVINDLPIEVLQLIMEEIQGENPVPKESGN